MRHLFYNDNDPRCVTWLRALVARGLLPHGIVCGKSVAAIAPSDAFGVGLLGAHQAHFFAGIGGWPLACAIAGLTELELWTASLPCQPFSVAGRRKGTTDERHLWPIFRELVAELTPPILFGEQTASPPGRDWLATVRADLEALGYAVGAADLCAAGAGAPHLRQRLYWGAYRVADATRERRQGQRLQLQPGRPDQASPEAGRGSQARRVGDPDVPGPQGRGVRRDSPSQRTPRAPSLGDWGVAGWVPCADGFLRPLGPAPQPVADGLPSRMVLLHGVGNAIVPQLAAVFMRSFIDAVEDSIPSNLNKE